MDLEIARLLSDWAQYIVTGAVGGALALWAILGRRDAALARQIAAIASQTQAQSERVTALEAGRAALVMRETLDAGLARAHQRMDGFEGKVGHMNGTLDSICRAVSRIETYLLEHGASNGA